MAVRNATIFVRRRCNWGVTPRLAEKIRKLEGIAVAQNPILLGGGFGIEDEKLSLTVRL